MRHWDFYYFGNYLISEIRTYLGFYRPQTEEEELQMGARFELVEKAFYLNQYSKDYENPLVEMVTLVGAAHSNADYMATVAWDFMSHFSHDVDGSLLEQ